MKKILSVIALTAVLLSSLVACNGNTPTTLPDGVSGKDAIRLLLADERLNEQLLKNEGNIFNDGVEVMNTLAAKAIENLGVTYLSARATEQRLTLTPLSRETISSPDTMGKLEKEGDTYYFSEFEENNNSYDYFENLTMNIVDSAKVAADLIDNVKRNVRVVDKWVDVYGAVRYFLHVEENSELLVEHYTAEGLDILNVCIRYRNAAGKDVYELYRRSLTEQYEQRMTYVPGERYELSMRHNAAGNESMDSFVADHSKGYWETGVFAVWQEHSNISYFVMKDDLCYDAFYSATEGSISSIKIMSADCATDLMNVTNYERVGRRMPITLKFSGFDGIDWLEAPASGVEYNAEGKFANVMDGQATTLRFTSGKTARSGDTFADGAVIVRDIYASYNASGYLGEMMLEIEGEGQEAQMASLRQFLAEVGMTCRRDMDGVIAGMEAAFVDAADIAKHYKWNGVSITDQASVLRARDKELERFAAMLAHYTDVQNAEVIDVEDTARMAQNIHFASVTESSFASIAWDGMSVTVGASSLTVTDTLLFVRDEPYKLAFALADAEGGLVHLETENTATTPFADGEAFTVTAPSAVFTVPMLAPGTYTLVAYMATADGVRSSAYTPVTVVGEIVSAPVHVGKITMSAAKGATNALTLTYAETTDVMLTMVPDERAKDCATFKAALSELAFAYGTPAEVIEMLGADGSGSYVELGEETAIAYTTYRIAYKVSNGNRTVEGYVYVDLVAE